MKTSSAKSKGRRLQQMVRDMVLDLFKSLTPNDVRSTGMGQSGVDVQLSEAALKLFPYSVECKNKERMNIWKELEQAEENVLPSTQPLLVMKKNRTAAYAVIRLEHLMELLRDRQTT